MENASTTVLEMQFDAEAYARWPEFFLMITTEGLCRSSMCGLHCIDIAYISPTVPEFV